MGRASRRKRANGGPGFFRREHLLAAAAPRAGAPREADAQEDDAEHQQRLSGRNLLQDEEVERCRRGDDHEVKQFVIAEDARP